MKTLKKSVALATLIAMFATSASSVSADEYGNDAGYCENAEYCTDTAGYGYEDCCRAPQIGPAIALGAIALAAIIAIAVQNSSHSGHGHSH